MINPSIVCQHCNEFIMALEAEVWINAERTALITLATDYLDCEEKLWSYSIKQALAAFDRQPRLLARFALLSSRYPKTRAAFETITNIALCITT